MIQIRFSYLWYKEKLKALNLEGFKLSLPFLSPRTVHFYVTFSSNCANQTGLCFYMQYLSTHSPGRLEGPLV